MKAHTEADSETTCNESFETFTSPHVDLQCAINGDSTNKEPLENAEKGLRNFFGEDVESTESCPSSCKYSVISGNTPSEGLYHPLHFNTNEALEKTPAIFKSLNSSGRRGPDTYVFNSSLKPWDDDPYKTFVITSDKSESIDKENSLSKTLTMSRRPNSDSDEKNEYLSYVIEKTNVYNPEKMNAEGIRPSSNKNSSNDDNDEDENKELYGTSRVLNEKERVVGVSCLGKESGESGEKVDSNKSEICDKNVQCGSEKTAEDTTDLSFDKTITGKKEQTFARLQDELQKAHEELKLKDEEVTRLTRIREDVERELEELTASLFQEAHKMVSKAKEKQAAAEKSLKESQMKVDVLTAEVIALKTLVLTSTPSRPNPHLHPQIGKEDSSGGVNLFNKKHRRSPSHFNLKYGRENSPPESPVRDDQSTVQSDVSTTVENKDIADVDPIVHKEFVNWTLTFKLDKTDPFIDRIYREDINLCLDFSNRELAEEVQKAIETRNIFIEAVTDKTKTIFPRKCALLEVTRQCYYRMKLGDEDNWYNISQMCRNRIIAVCDFINYLRYIELGLVKSSVHDMYWEIMRLRKEMVLARLGLSLPSP